MTHLSLRTAAPHLGHGIQHRLNIRRRAGDDAQNLARRSLLFQRFFEFLEQPHVLDGDHRLMGERLEKLDLAIAERPDFRTANMNNAQAATLPALTE